MIISLLPMAPRIARSRSRFAAFHSASESSVFRSSSFSQYQVRTSSSVIFVLSSVVLMPLHTPFVLFGRGIPKGLVLEQPVENIDLYPTMLELCGLPVPGRLAGRP